MWIVEVVQRVLSGHVLDHDPKRMPISKTKVNVSSQSYAHCDFLCLIPAPSAQLSITDVSPDALGSIDATGLTDLMVKCTDGSRLLFLE